MRPNRLGGCYKYKPTPDDVKQLVKLHKKQGFQCVLLWGFEWWWQMKFTNPRESEEWFAHIRELAQDFRAKA